MRWIDVKASAHSLDIRITQSMRVIPNLQKFIGGKEYGFNR